MFTVYVRADERGRVTEVNSSAFLVECAGFTAIDSGTGDRYAHAQGNYLPKPLLDERGIPRYRLQNGKLFERTAQEMDADMLPSVPVQTDAQRMNALEEELRAAKILLGLEE